MDESRRPTSIALGSSQDRTTDSHLCVEVIRSKSSLTPRVGIILGTGLGEFAETLEERVEFAYAEIPGFPVPSAAGHRGRLILGKIGRVDVAVLQGRCHLYEGRAYEEVCHPVRTLHRLGVSSLITTCAAGGLATDLRVGDLLVLQDHVNLQFRRSVNFTNGFQFPYCERTSEKLLEIMRKQDIPGRLGSYLAVTGPNYETRAELRFFRRIADSIGMSTIPEVLTAHQLGMSVASLATITNVCNPDQAIVADCDHVIAAAAETAPRVRRLITTFLENGLCRSDTMSPVTASQTLK
ncbi:MAG: purine-nucleoside phosphorylase [Planctomycetaceae bacterium]|nr:purine-nucleoside phosphorylase [Planctomycetaceae bacterium]